MAVYASLFGIGRIVFGATGSGVALLALAALAFAWIARNLSRGERLPEPAAPAVEAPERVLALK